MSRIRNVKPELFFNYELWEEQEKTKLPLQVCWIGLFTQTDRGGVFRWKPAELRAYIQPYDTKLDFSLVLESFIRLGFIKKFVHDDQEYGFIVNFTLYQAFSSGEKAKFPKYNEDNEVKIEISDTDRTQVRHESDSSLPDIGHRTSDLGQRTEDVGRMTGDQKNTLPTIVANPEPKPKSNKSELNKKTEKAIARYCELFKQKYGTNPIVQGKQIGLLTTNLKTISLENMILMFEVYFEMQDPWYTTHKHSIECFNQNINSIKIKADTGTEYLKTQNQNKSARELKNEQIKATREANPFREKKNE